MPPRNPLDDLYAPDPTEDLDMGMLGQEGPTEDDLMAAGGMMEGQGTDSLDGGSLMDEEFPYDAESANLSMDAMGGGMGMDEEPDPLATLFPPASAPAGGFDLSQLLSQSRFGGGRR
jgi:hypothetical protein